MLGVIHIELQFKVSTLCSFLKTQSLPIYTFEIKRTNTPPPKKVTKNKKTPYLLCLFLSLISSAWRDKQIQSALSSSLGHITETKRSIKIQTCTPSFDLKTMTISFTMVAYLHVYTECDIHTDNTYILLSVMPISFE